jgi:hypothetical protein
MATRGGLHHLDTHRKQFMAQQDPVEPNQSVDTDLPRDVDYIDDLQAVPPNLSRSSPQASRVVAASSHKQEKQESVSAHAPALTESVPPAPELIPERGIIVIGRRAAGKSVFMARLYESLWQGANFLDGRLLPTEVGLPPNGTFVRCRAVDGVTHSYLMGAAQELRKGRWPIATIGRTWLDLLVEHGGQQHRLSMLDYPGEAFRRAFMQMDLDSDSTALRSAVLGASAVIILIDPAVIPEDGSGALEDTFGMLQAVSLIRRREDGFRIPIAIVFTKSDANAELLRNHGGVRGFVARYFKQLYKECRRVRMFSSASVRVKSVDGRILPDASGLPGNVVEPLVYCLRRIEGQERSDAYRARLDREAERADSKRGAFTIGPRLGWSLFLAAVTIAFLGAIFAALAYIESRGAR